MRKIDHAPKYTRRIGNRMRNTRKRKGIRKIMWWNKVINKSVIFKRRLFFEAITKTSRV
jgi:hypothetical protein